MTQETWLEGQYQTVEAWPKTRHKDTKGELEEIKIERNPNKDTDRDGMTQETWIEGQYQTEEAWPKTRHKDTKGELEETKIERNQNRNKDRDEDDTRDLNRGVNTRQRKHASEIIKAIKYTSWSKAWHRCNRVNLLPYKTRSRRVSQSSMIDRVLLGPLQVWNYWQSSDTQIPN